MKQVSLQKIYLANFRSFVKPTHITLSNTAGLKLIAGENLLERRLGGNGCGKSTLWDAVAFALYGTSVKGLRAADLVSYGRQTTDVQVTLLVDGQPVKVRRTAPPMRLWLNEQLAEQAEVDRLVGLSRERFCHSVIFGQAVPLFIDLPVPQRGDLLDEVLGLELWLLAADRAATAAKEQQNKLTELRQRLAHTQGQLDGLGDIARLRDAATAWDDARGERLEAALTLLEAAEVQGRLLQAALAEPVALVNEVETKATLDNARKHNARVREEEAAIQAEVRLLTTELEFLEQNNICPTCNQPLTEAHKEQHYQRLRPRLEHLERLHGITKLDITTSASTIEAYELTWRGAVRENQRKHADRTVLVQQAEAKQREVDRLVADAERIAGESNPHTAEYDRALLAREQLTTALADLHAAELQLVGLLTEAEFWRQGFRRVRLFCLERVLQELTTETRNALLALGLPAWAVVFKTATETKAGTLRLGVQAEVQGPTAVSKFDSLSGGEGQRARLAVSLGLATLIQRWAGVRYDFEVYDEPTAWLSEPGVEDLLSSLQARADMYNRSIWVCDHRAHIYSGFQETWRIVKAEGGSYVTH